MLAFSIVQSAWTMPFYLAVNGNEDINTTYSMGTAAMTLLAALLWT